MLTKISSYKDFNLETITWMIDHDIAIMILPESKQQQMIGDLYRL